MDPPIFFLAQYFYLNENVRRIRKNDITKGRFLKYFLEQTKGIPIQVLPRAYFYTKQLPKSLLNTFHCGTVKLISEKRGIDASYTKCLLFQWLNLKKYSKKIFTFYL